MLTLQGTLNCPPAPLGAMTDSLLQPLLLSHVSLEEFGILSFFTIFSELSFSLAVKMEQWVFVFFFIFFFSS